MAVITTRDNLTTSGHACDLILSATVALANVGQWIGPEAVFSSTLAGVGILDVRQYSAIHLTLGASALTGTSPTLQLLLATYDDADSSALAGPQFTVTQTVPSGGGVVEAIFGVTPTTHVGISDNFALARSAHRLRFFRVGVSANGTTVSTVTSGRLRVWGYR